MLFTVYKTNSLWKSKKKRSRGTDKNSENSNQAEWFYHCIVIHEKAIREVLHVGGGLSNSHHTRILTYQYNTSDGSTSDQNNHKCSYFSSTLSRFALLNYIDHPLFVSFLNKIFTVINDEIKFIIMLIYSSYVSSSREYHRAGIFWNLYLGYWELHQTNALKWRGRSSL